MGKKTKEQLWSRLYGNAASAPCCWCKTPLSFKEATVEHLLARSRGGTSDQSNLDLACGPCNWGRGDGLPPCFKGKPSKPYVPVVRTPAEQEAHRTARLAASRKAESLGLQVWSTNGVCYVGTPFRSVLASATTFDEAFALVEEDFELMQQERA